MNSFITDKLASLNRLWPCNNGTFRASGMAGIEPIQSQLRVTGHRFLKNIIITRVVENTLDYEDIIEIEKEKTRCYIVWVRSLFLHRLFLVMIFASKHQNVDENMLFFIKLIFKFLG